MPGTVNKTGAGTLAFLGTTAAATINVLGERLDIDGMAPANVAASSGILAASAPSPRT